MHFTHLKEIDMRCEIFNEINSYACTLVPTIVQWHGKTEFKYHFRFSLFFALLKQVLKFHFHFSLVFIFCHQKTASNFHFCFQLSSPAGKRISTFRFSFSYGALKTDLNFVFRFCVALENGIH